MIGDGFRCTEAADARHEPLYGTASFVKRWLLLEQPGSWGPDALMQSRFPKDVAVELRRRTSKAGIRLILIRRGAGLSSDRRRCYFARTDLDEPYLARLELERVDDLLDVDFEALTSKGDLDDALRQRDPLFLICTHGRHDACCSIRGNQVSRVACAYPQADAWECSHIGGDRFAANLVCFPHGIYYGRVGPDDAVPLMEAYAAGSLSLRNYRGRSCYPFPIQATEYFARAERGLTGIDQVWLISSEQDGNLVTATFLVGTGERVEIGVRVEMSSDAHRLTCGATTSSWIPRYKLASVEVLGLAEAPIRPDEL